jgi:N-acetylmuramoyl-L-alanine amidase
MPAGTGDTEGSVARRAAVHRTRPARSSCPGHAAKLALPISYRPHVPLRVRRRPPRSARRPFLAALALLAAALVLVLLDRSCAGAAGPAHPPLAVAANRPGPAPDPAAALSPGACRALPPTGRSRGRTVFVDAGHGGPDPGVLGSTPAGAQLQESALALAVATDLGADLRAAGYGVVLSRTGDSSVLSFPGQVLEGGAMSPDQVRQDLEARVHCANRSGAAVLVSVHFNGYGDPSAEGAQTIYDAERPFADSSRRLAASLQTALVQRLGLGDRGLLTDDELQAPVLSDQAGAYGHLILLGPAQQGWLDQGTTMPGALVEPLFLTSPADASRIAGAASQRRMAAALAAGVQGYLDSSR